MDGGALLGLDSGTILGVGVGIVKKTSLNVFLGVIPSTTGVGEREGNLDTRNNVTSQKTGNKSVGEENTTKERSKNNNSTRGDHVLERGVSGDGDAFLVIGLCTFLNERNLSSDLKDHGLSGVTDSGHGKSRESVWEHSTNEETSEGNGLKDVDGSGSNGILFIVGNKVGLNTSDIGTEESKSDESGRTNGETLTNSSGSVTSSIEGISSLTDIFLKVAHLSNTTSVIRDGTIAINGEGNREAAEHTNGRQSNTVHSGPLESEKDGDGKADNGDNGGHVTEGETLDDVGGGIVGTGTSELSGGAIRVGSVVLSGNTDSKTRPETEHDAAISLPVGASVFLVSEVDIEGFRDDAENANEHSRHQKSGDDKLHLELEFNGTVVDVSKEGGNEGSTNTNSSNNHREVDCIVLGEKLMRGAGNNESSASGFSKGTEKISTHTSNITNVITNVVSNSTRVERRVFRELLTNLTSKISTDISSLSVDTTTDSTEKSNSGTAKTVTGNVLEKFSNEVRPGKSSHFTLTLKDSRLVGKNNDLKDEKSKTNEGKSEDLTTTESMLETLFFGDVATVGGLNVGFGSDHHTNVTSSHGGDSTNPEGNGGKRGFGGSVVVGGPWDIDGTEEDNTEEEAEDTQV